MEVGIFLAGAFLNTATLNGGVLDFPLGFFPTAELGASAQTSAGGGSEQFWKVPQTVPHNSASSVERWVEVP